MGTVRNGRDLDLEALISSFGRSLRAKNRAKKTQRAYLAAAHMFADFRTHHGHAPGTVTRSDVETFIADQLEQWTPSTAATRYRCLQQFFNFLVEEGELERHPMEHMKPPSVGESPVPVLRDDELRALLAVCEGRGFENRRDAAIIRVFVDTGARLGELAGMSVADVDLDEQMILVTGKGDRARWLPIGNTTVMALDRYLRERRRHRFESSEALWLGVKGPLTDSGVTQMLRRRAGASGVKDLHPHRFRHTFAHHWLASGGNEGDLQTLAGWRSPQMLARYGASAKAERARQAHRRLAPADRL